jgi:hypothetical protein
VTTYTDCIEDTMRRNLERRIRAQMPDLLDAIERYAGQGFKGNFAMEQAIEEAMLMIGNAAVDMEQQRQWREDEGDDT